MLFWNSSLFLLWPPHRKPILKHQIQSYYVHFCQTTSTGNLIKFLELTSERGFSRTPCIVSMGSTQIKYNRSLKHNGHICWMKRRWMSTCGCQTFLSAWTFHLVPDLYQVQKVWKFRFWSMAHFGFNFIFLPSIYSVNSSIATQ